MCRIDKNENEEKAKIIPIKRVSEVDKRIQTTSIGDLYYQAMKDLDDLIAAAINKQDE